MRITYGRAELARDFRSRLKVKGALTWEAASISLVMDRNSMWGGYTVVFKSNLNCSESRCFF